MLFIQIVGHVIFENRIHAFVLASLLCACNTEQSTSNPVTLCDEFAINQSPCQDEGRTCDQYLMINQASSQPIVASSCQELSSECLMDWQRRDDTDTQAECGPSWL